MALDGAGEERLEARGDRGASKFRDAGSVGPRGNFV